MKPCLYGCVCLTAVAVGPLHADLVDDFDSYLAGAPLPNDDVDPPVDPASPWVNASSASVSADVEEDIDDFFGASNVNYLELIDTGAKVRVDAFNLGLSELVSVRFDFYEPDPAPTDPIFAFEPDFLGFKAINSGDIIDARFDDGVLEVRGGDIDGDRTFNYAVNQANTFLAVINAGAAQETYDDPNGGVATFTVDPGKIDYWIGAMGGTLSREVTGLSTDGGLTGAGEVIDQMFFQTNTNGWGQVVYVDNVAFTSSAAAALDGDYNGDGSVDQGDLDLVLLNWGDDASVSGVPAGWVNMQPGGLIGQTELDGVLLNWGNTTEPDSGVAVPEPAALALMGGLGLIRRRRRLA